MSTASKISISFTFVLIVIVALGVNAYLSTQRMLSANQWVAHTHRVLEKLEHIQAVHTDAETGQRGFLLTGEDRYLQPYIAAQAAVTADINSLKDLTAENADHQADLEKVQSLSDQKFAELARTIDLRRNRGFDAALAMVRTEHGKQLMDELRRVIVGMQERERVLLEARNETAEKSAHSVSIAFAVWTPISLLLLALIALRVIRTVRFGGPVAEPNPADTAWATVILRYGFAVVTVAIATALRWKISEAIGEIGRFITLFPAVLIVAIVAGGGPGAFATILAAMAADYFFLEPKYSLAMSRPEDLISISIFISTNLFLCVFAERLRRARWAEAVAVQKELLGVTLASIGDAVITTDALGRVTFLNKEAERLTGWTSDDAFQRPLPEVFRIINEESRKTVENPVDKVLRLKAVVGLANHTILISKDGRETPIDDSGAPVRDKEGELHGVVLVFRDFTEHKKTEAALRAAKVSAEHAKAGAESANKAKDDFLAVLSHELRTPLTPVVATLSMMQSDPRFDPEAREDLEMIRRNVELEARLIDDLLDVTRIERGKIELHKQVVDVGMLVHHAAAVCMPDVQARMLTLKVDAEECKYAVFGDPARIQQVLWNLLKNAVKFTPQGGRIDLRCRAEENGMVVIDVADTGEGIAPEILPRVFNAFEQGDRRVTRRFGGLGLGLAISKAIVDLHGGSLVAASRGKGQGATFTVRLPLHESSPSAGNSAALQSNRESAAPLRILLVEDHEDTAMVMRKLLAYEGHTITLAAQIAPAIELASTREFDLIVSDLGLPDGSGLELIRALRAKGIATPAIALSGYGQEQDMRQSREAGFADHLVKPVSLPRLNEAIARVAAG